MSLTNETIKYLKECERRAKYDPMLTLNLLSRNDGYAYGRIREDIDVSSFYPKLEITDNLGKKDILDIARKQMMENNHLRAKYEASRSIVKVIFNDPATIVFWSDGEKNSSKDCSWRRV